MPIGDQFIWLNDDREFTERESIAADTGLPPGCLDASGRLREYTEAERVQRAEDIRAMFRELDAIGTPEEQAETHDFLMKALAETRRSEGRVF